MLVLLIKGRFLAYCGQYNFGTCFDFLISVVVPDNFNLGSFAVVLLSFRFFPIWGKFYFCHVAAMKP